jgi:mono/diheme cytochrome c family protein
MKTGFTLRHMLIALMSVIAPAVQATNSPPPTADDNPATPAAPQADQDAKPLQPVTGSRGQLLYEDHCQGCHTSIVHVREDHRAQSWVELKGWVTHWSKELKLTWKAGEIGDVVDYLNQTYYKFEVPIIQPR